MKKILSFLLCILTLTTFFCISVGAQGTSGENYTLLGRFWEFVEAYRPELIGLAGDGILLLLTLFVSIRQKKKASDVKLQLTQIAQSSTGMAAGQGGMLSATNGLITAYNEMTSAYRERQSTEDERARAVGALVVQTEAILEILAAVYPNSKNLPQGVKDLVNLKYAKCQAALADDTLLKEVAASVLASPVATTESEAK